MADILGSNGIDTLGKIGDYVKPNGNGYCKDFKDISGIGPKRSNKSETLLSISSNDGQTMSETRAEINQKILQSPSAKIVSVNLAALEASQSQTTNPQRLSQSKPPEIPPELRALNREKNAERSKRTDRAKYNSRKVFYNGMWFDSEWECKRWKMLVHMANMGHIQMLSRQRPFRLHCLSLNGKNQNHHIQGRFCLYPPGNFHCGRCQG